MNITHTHAVPPGPSLAEKMAEKLDRAYKNWQEFVEEGDGQDPYTNRAYGRVEGCAAQLGILRSTSTKEEIARAKERHDA